MNATRVLAPLMILTACLPVDGQVYWSDSGADNITRANQISGEGHQMIVNIAHVAPGMALDGVTETIYWSRGRGASCMPPAQDDCGAIYKSHLDGTQTELLIGPLQYGALAIALDTDAGHIYWTGGPDSGLKGILRANLDGTGQDLSLIHI